MSRWRKTSMGMGFEAWGRVKRGFFADTCYDQAPVVFRVRDVPGADRNAMDWVLVALSNS